MTCDIGKAAETLALHYLASYGFRCVQQNYQAKRFGEIDLIGWDGQILVFVEVKWRKDQRYGTAAEMVTPAKQQRIRQAANHFLSHYVTNALPPCRFDVVAMSPSHTHWIKAAF